MELMTVVAVLLAYLLGSFPTGFLAARSMAGIDVRTIGSGRTGGSNVLRSAGGRAGLVTVIGDSLKGLLAVLIARQLTGGDPLAEGLAAMAVVLGHNYSIFLRFKGGAGTMTASGAAFGLNPIAMVVASIIPVTMTYITRMSSVGSLLGSANLLLVGAILAWQDYLPAEYLTFFIGFFLLSWYSHIPNIRRLMAGTERRLGQKSTT